MTDERQLDAKNAALDCYLSTLLTTANMLAQACPEVGVIYRHRLTRLRARLAFDSSAASLEESCPAVESELKEYGVEASAYVTHSTGELRSALGALAEIVHHLAQRQDFYAARLRQFARQMETVRYPAKPEELTEVVAMQASGLLSCVESMSHDTQSLMTKTRDEMAAMERRIKAASMIDLLTGLMNRREMERKIEAFKASGAIPVLLHFRLTAPLPDEAIQDEVIQQVATRLASQFRHKDFIGRWSDAEFMVLFQGPADVARARSERIVPWVAGRYTLENGQGVEIGMEVEVLAPELAKSAV
jgi:GGDEF domain-containing protein